MTKISLAPIADPVPALDEDLERVGNSITQFLWHSTRLQRGIALAEERFEEIHRIAPWSWSVPSYSGKHTYTVNLKTSSCSCPDRPPDGERCKHVSAAAYKKSRTAICSGCSNRFRHRDLFSVGEDHLTFFEGELLCEECALDHGVL